MNFQDCNALGEKLTKHLKVTKIDKGTIEKLIPVPNPVGTEQYQSYLRAIIIGSSSLEYAKSQCGETDFELFVVFEENKTDTHWTMFPLRDCKKEIDTAFGD